MIFKNGKYFLIENTNLFHLEYLNQKDGRLSLKNIIENNQKLIFDLKPGFIVKEGVWINT